MIQPEHVLIRKFNAEHMTELAKKMYNFLEANKYFKENPQIDSEAEWSNITRDRQLVYSISKTLDGVLTKDVLSKLDNPYNGDPKTNLLTILHEQRFNLVYPQYEKLKRMLCIALDFKKIKLGKKHPTYGDIITALKNKKIEKNIVNVMDNELRNIIAHRDWYVKDGQFICTANNKKHIIEWKELNQRLNNLKQFSDLFCTLYFFYYHTPPGIKERKKHKNHII